MDSLYTLMESMSDYIASYTILSSKSEFHFVYIVKIYDSIETDLDFDEEYYNNILERLQTLVISECTLLIMSSQSTFEKATIITGKQIMSKKNSMDIEIIIKKHDLTYRYLK